MDNNTTSGYGTTNDSQGFRQSNVSHPPPYPVSNVDNRPKDTTYPPVSQAYPPVSSAYPDPSAGNLPPSTAPPPYTAIYPPQTTSVSNNTTVVINEPPASRYVNDYTTQVGFNSKTIRLGFIRKVFAILSIQLLVTVGSVCLFIFVPSVKDAGQNLPVYVAAYVIFLVLYIVLVCCDGVRRAYPANIILLSLFTLSLSYLVGVISSYHDTKIVLIMMGVTAAVTISVSLFACQTKFDMTKFGGVLLVFALVVFFVLVFSPVFLLVTTVGKIAIGGALALLFTAFLIYDVQLIMGGRKYELSEEEYVLGALVLYIDIVNIMLILLYIFGGSNN